METAKISTSVDVKLNHQDMIEMLVEEQLENFENQLATKMGEMSHISKDEEDLKKKIEASVLKDAKLDKDKSIKPLMAAAKLLGLTIASNNEVNWKAVGKPFDEHNEVQFSQFEHLKNPMTKYKEANASLPGYNVNIIKKKEYHHAEILDISTQFRANDGTPSKDRWGHEHTKVTIRLEKDGVRVKPHKQSATTKSLFVKLKALTVKAANLDKEIYSLKCQLFELENSGKRHKAKFLKAMLGNSETGKSLLTIMKNVGGMNLLESGQE